MDASRRLPWHVPVATALVVFQLMWMVAVVPATASRRYHARRSENENANCLSSLSATALQGLTNEVSSLSNIFDHLLPNVLMERVSGSNGNILVREFIKSEMTALGWGVEEDIFREQTPYGVVTFSNIIATLNPAATRRVVIACHYDSKYMQGNVPFVGASDSALPCSVMMNTGKLLSHVASNRPATENLDITPQLIFFDGEEAFVRWTSTDSLYGSRHLANMWENTPDPSDFSADNNLVNINFFILLDLIGTSDTRFVNYYTNTSHLFGQLVSIEQCLRRNNLMTRQNPSVIFNPFGRAQMVEDDHIPFVRRGVRVLHLISTPFPRVWHTVQDNLRSLNVGLIDDFSRIFNIFLLSVLYGV